MTTTFWFAAAALIGLALAFIAYPLVFRRPQQRADADRRQQNLMAYRSRMAELAAEYEAGNIDADNYQQLRDELAGSLLDEVETAADTAQPRPDYRQGGARAVALASLVMVPVLAVLMYQQLGSMDKVEEWVALQERDTSDQGRAQEMATLANQLRERLVANPDNAEGWAMLGRTYMTLEQYQDAAWAFEQLAKQVGGQTGREATAWGLSAQAQFFASRGEMTDAVRRAIDNARQLNADEVNSLGLLGIKAFEEENYEQAIGYWERIVEVAPNHPQLASIREGIAAAYDRLGRDMPSQNAAAEVSGPGVTVRVELSEAFAGSVPPDTTLFLYAREPGGAGAPLAIARARAGELPLTIRLDDRRAMAPESRISQADEVVVTARLSPSGSAMPQPGDWQGRTDVPVPVAPEGSEPTTLVIDQQLH